LRELDELLDLLYEDESIVESCYPYLPKIDSFLRSLHLYFSNRVEVGYFLEIVGKIKENILEGKKMGVLTITFELGSGGLEVAQKVSEALGYRLVFSEILDEVAKRLGVPKKEVEVFDEFNYFPSKLSFFGLFQLDKSFVDFGAIFKTEKKEVNLETFRDELGKVITAFAVSNNVVIVGHGSACILKEYPDAIHVKLEAPFEYRVKRLAERENLEENEAREKLRRIDEKEREFIADICGREVDRVELFHMILNTAKLGTEKCAQIIVSAVRENES